MLVLEPSTEIPDVPPIVVAIGKYLRLGSVGQNVFIESIRDHFSDRVCNQPVLQYIVYVEVEVSWRHDHHLLSKSELWSTKRNQCGVRYINDGNPRPLKTFHGDQSIRCALS